MLQALTIDQIRQIVEVAEKLTAEDATGVVNVGDAIASMSLRTHLHDLSAEAMLELKALMWMGKGDCADFDTAVARAKTQDNPIRSITDQATIPSYLRKGAAMLGLQLAQHG